MTLKEIVAKFDDVIEKLEPIGVQPSDTDITLIPEVLEPPLLQIPYNEMEGTHNLIGLIRLVAAYKTLYGAELHTVPTKSSFNSISIIFI